MRLPPIILALILAILAHRVACKRVKIIEKACKRLGYSGVDPERILERYDKLTVRVPGKKKSRSLLKTFWDNRKRKKPPHPPSERPVFDPYPNEPELLERHPSRRPNFDDYPKYYQPRYSELPHVPPSRNLLRNDMEECPRYFEEPHRPSRYPPEYPPEHRSEYPLEYRPEYPSEYSPGCYPIETARNQTPIDETMIQELCSRILEKMKTAMKEEMGNKKCRRTGSKRLGKMVGSDRIFPR